MEDKVYRAVVDRVSPGVADKVAAPAVVDRAEVSGGKMTLIVFPNLHVSMNNPAATCEVSYIPPPLRGYN